MVKLKQSQDLNKGMVTDLIEKLRQYPDLDLYRTTESIVWDKYENNLAHFVIREQQIVGCCFIWANLNSNSWNFPYVELGTVWINNQIRLPQKRLPILRELQLSIKWIARDKKIMAFCKKIKLAEHFKASPFFPFSKIANHQSCPQDLMGSIPQFQGWFTEDLELENQYTRLLYLEDRNIVTPWYVIYE